MLAAAVMLLPKGFSDDLSKIGRDGSKQSIVNADISEKELRVALDDVLSR